jgi:hypothetical protein
MDGGRPAALIGHRLSFVDHVDTAVHINLIDGLASVVLQAGRDR